jgi:hypothetical protein
MSAENLSDDEVRSRLRERGAAEHVIRGGREGLIRAWRRFVDEVQAGYRFGIEDYRNDLDTRTLIHTAGLDSEAAEDDAKFRSLLTHTDRRIWESDAPDPFWVRGYPRTASGRLLEDLRAEGLAE